MIDQPRTPYQRHVHTRHATTFYSPDGFVKVEECAVCGMRFLHDPCIGYPVTLYHYPELIQIVD